MQNYLVWRLVLDRVSSLSQRYKDARANYRKVCEAPPGAPHHPRSPYMLPSTCWG